MEQGGTFTPRTLAVPRLWPRVTRIGRVAAHAAGSPLLGVAFRRLLIAIPVLFGVTLLTFFVLDALPGDAARQLLGPEASAQQVAQLRRQLSLDRPTLERYAVWLKNAARGDLGRSLANGRPVREAIAGRLAVSLQLLAYAFVFSLVPAVPVALLAAHRNDGVFDSVTQLLSMLGLSVANYVLALALVLVFSVHLGWFPSIGFKPLRDGLFENARSLTLPALSMAVPLFCYYTRFLRGDLIEQMREGDYIVTAIAKGLSAWRALVRHALRNSLFGLLTVVGINFGSLIGGTVVIEQIFGLPGIGQLLLQAINTRDASLVQGIVLLLAIMTVGANLAADILYAVLDPRVRYDQH